MSDEEEKDASIELPKDNVDMKKPKRVESIIPGAESILHCGGGETSKSVVLVFGYSNLFELGSDLTNVVT